MNIYFACSITGGREFEAVYQAITAALLDDGHEVPTAHLAGADVVALEQIVQPGEVYGRDVAWIRACDALIAEVSTPSHGVGYEIGYALGLGKPVLCCHQAGRSVSKMITGNPDPGLTVRAYTGEGQAVQIVREFLSNIQS
ncbi:MAG: nucleoside 2-deoxyribosyltransferase, partial [Chloroflexota bacterium]